MAKKLSVEYVPVAKLVPYAHNARLHSDDQVRQIVALIREYGWTNPILIDKEHGIIAGHGRVLAAQQMKMKNVPAIRLDGMTEEQKRAYVIADNKVALNATWDEDILEKELAALLDTNLDVDLIGFGRDELSELGLDVMNDTLEPGEAPQTDRGSLLRVLDVSIDEPKHKVKRGDVYRVGKHWLYCLSVLSDWGIWGKALKGADAVFVPYPGPLVPLGLRADDHTLIMVQPDGYIAGHILDRYEDAKGKGTVDKQVAQ